MKNSRIARNVARVHTHTHTHTHTSNSKEEVLATLNDAVLLRYKKIRSVIGTKKHSYCYGF